MGFYYNIKEEDERGKRERESLINDHEFVPKTVGMHDQAKRNYI